MSSSWLGRLGNLNVSRSESRGPSPHKPLMLLTVMDLIEAGEVEADGIVVYDVRLVSRFRDYWELVLDRQRNSPDIPMPFHALGGARDRVWTRLTSDGAPSHAKTTTRLALLDSDLFRLFWDASFRRAARRTLISIYFMPREQVMLCARLGLPLPDTSEIESLRRDADAFKASQRKGRDSRFKSEVLGGYHYTCALTGYRLDTETTSLVQAAHIHQHAVSGNDDPRNGLALTPDAHWMFDQGLWTAIPVGNDLLVHVATSRFTESSPSGRRLATLQGKPLHFHAHARLRPMMECLAWHARKHRLL